MSILSGNPLRFPLLFVANVALKAKRYEEAFDHMEEFVKAAGKSRNQLTPSELNLFFIVFETRISSLLVGGLLEKSDKLELVSVCLRILKLLDTILIPLAGPKAESKELLLKMKSECYRYLAEARDKTREKRPVTRRFWLV